MLSHSSFAKEFDRHHLIHLIFEDDEVQNDYLNVDTNYIVR